MADRGPGEGLQPLDELGVVGVERSVFDDGDRAEELEGGLPEVVGVLVPVEGRLLAFWAQQSLDQRQREPRDQRLLR